MAAMQAAKSRSRGTDTFNSPHGEPRANRLDLRRLRQAATWPSAVTMLSTTSSIRMRSSPSPITRITGSVPDVLQDLRQRVKAVADLRHRTAQPLHHGQHLQRRDEAVAGRGVVGQDDVAGWLTAKIIAAAEHPLEHVTIADRRAHKLKADAVQKSLEPEIRHHGGDDAGPRQAAVFLPALRDHCEQLVAVDEVAAFVDQYDAV